MFLFFYRLKCLVWDKVILFWTLLFPLVMATLFFFAFSNLSSADAFSTIPIAVVEKEGAAGQQFFDQALKAASAGDSPLFSVTKATREEADALLRDSEIDGYLVVDDELQMVAKQTGIHQTILKSFLDQFQQTSHTVERIAQEHPERLPALLEQLGNAQSYVQQTTPTGKRPDEILNYFYALIAMTSLFGSFWGLRNITDIQADLSEQGARRSVAPTHKLRLIVCDAAAALVVQYAEMLLLIVYLAFVLNVDLGGQVGYVLLAALAGSMTGVSMGSFIAAVIKKREGIKIALLIGLSLLLCFFSGLMNTGIRDIVNRAVPAMRYLNPANVITDAFYSLCYFDTYTRYAMNIGILFGFSLVFCLGAYFIVRRRKYASL